MKTAIEKVTWVGRVTVFAVGLAVVLALTVGLATTVLAAVPGDPFKLGKTNAVNAISRLAGSVAGPSLQINNDSANASATALDLRVRPGKAPMKVNSAARVANLNSDRLDGQNSTAFFSGKTYDVSSSKTGSGNASFVSISVLCDDGDMALGGGGNTSTDDDEMTDSGPAAIPEAWFASFRDNGIAGNFTTLARCADFPPLR